MVFMNIWHDLSPKRVAADDFEAVIEIEKGSKCKYPPGNGGGTGPEGRGY